MKDLLHATKLHAHDRRELLMVRNERTIIEGFKTRMDGKQEVATCGLIRIYMVGRIAQQVERTCRLANRMNTRKVDGGSSPSTASRRII